jgi:hypothetical protein
MFGFSKVADFPHDMAETAAAQLPRRGHMRYNAAMFRSRDA